MTTADLWVAMPLLILMGGSVAVLIFGAAAPGRNATVVGLLALAAAAAWPLATPSTACSLSLGITCTPFARFFTILFTLTAAVTLLLSHDHNRRHGIHGEEYPATVLFAVFGMVTLSMASNLLVLFLGLEALTFAFYILVAIDRNSPASAEGGLKYLLFGAVAAAFIAFGIALIYADVGTLALVPAMQKALKAGAAPLSLAGWGLLLMGIAFKVSLVPAHLWTPDVYEGAPAPVVAFLSTGSKSAAFAALLLLTGQGVQYLHDPLWAMTLLSMVVGNLSALLQANLKRMLAYSSIAQMGYVALALLTGTAGGNEAVVFYLVAYSAMNLAAFGAIAMLGGSGNLEDYRGMGYVRPFTGGVLALAMLALTGIPPTAGFMGKFFIFAAALRGGETVLAIIGIVTAAVSAFYYLRVVVNLYMHPVQNAATIRSRDPAGWLALGGMAAGILFLGVYPAPLLKVISTLFF